MNNHGTSRLGQILFVWRTETAATAIEYAIMAALIAAVIVAVVVTVGKNTDAGFDQFCTEMSSKSALYTGACP